MYNNGYGDNNDNYAGKTLVFTFVSTLLAAFTGGASGLAMSQWTHLDAQNSIDQAKTAALGLSLLTVVSVPTYMLWVRDLPADHPIRGFLQLMIVSGEALLAQPVAKVIIPNDASYYGSTTTNIGATIALFFAVGILGHNILNCCKEDNNELPVYTTEQKLTIYSGKKAEVNEEVNAFGYQVT